MATNNNKLKHGLTKDTNQPLTLTALGIKALKKGFFIKCDRNKGLCLNHNFNDSYTWIYYYRTKAGKKGQIKLGNFYPQNPKLGLTLDSAKTAYLEQKTIRDAGLDPKVMQKENALNKANAEKEKAQAIKIKGYTAQNLVDDFIEEHAVKKRKDKGAQAQNYLKNYFVKQFNDIPVSEITLNEMYEHLKQVEFNTPSTAKKVKTDLRIAFDIAYRSGRLKRTIEGNPVTYAVDYSPEEENQRAIEGEELKYWLEWFDKTHFSDNVKDALYLTLYTGARSGEIVSARWEYFNLEEKTLFIPKEHSLKAKFDRNIQLNDLAMEVIKSRMGICKTYLFKSPKSNTHITQKALSTAIQKKVEDTYHPPIELDRREWTPHDLRRTCRTGISELDCPDEIAERIIGHKRAKIVGIYDKAHRYEKQREWLQIWADHLVELRGES